MSPHQADNKIILRCSNCGLTQENLTGIISTENIKKKKTRGGGFIDEKNTFANYANKCKKCGYDKAQILDLGIFYSDEDNLILLKCGKCGWSERIGRRTS